MNACFRISALSCALVAGAAFAQQVPSSASGRFDAMDSNRDGVVSKDEFDSDEAFRALDADRNNRVSAAELEAVIGPQQDGMPSAADRIRGADENGDGELTDEELRRGAEYRFHWLDTNRDGNLDLAEMRAGFGIPSPRP